MSISLPDSFSSNNYKPLSTLGESHDVAIIGHNQPEKNDWRNNRIEHAKSKKFRLCLMVIFTIFIVIATIFFACNALRNDPLKETATEQTLDKLEDSCGYLLTCDYYLNTPCKSTCWRNTWDIRDRECEQMGSLNCRWSFQAPLIILGGRCYCCDFECK